NRGYQSEGVKDKIGDFDTELVEEFFQGFVNYAQVTLHINLAYGKNSHHMIESIFKGFGRAVDQGSQKNTRVQGVPSTKGSLSKGEDNMILLPALLTSKSKCVTIVT